MIFNSLNKNAAEKINGDNCFVYACKMAGIPEEKLRVMRELIRVESFPKYRIKQICTVVGIRFNIKDAKSMETKSYGELDAEHTVNMLLMEDHYMIDEPIAISPFYIRYREEIEKASTTRNWSLVDKMCITKRQLRDNGTYYTREERTWDIKLVLSTIFEVEGFKPIVTGDLMKSGILMSKTEKKKCLFPITSLEYNEKYCCRLKCENPWKGRKGAA
jgi:hypothetical protein